MLPFIICGISGVIVGVALAYFSSLAKRTCKPRKSLIVYFFTRRDMLTNRELRLCIDFILVSFFLGIAGPLLVLLEQQQLYSGADNDALLLFGIYSLCTIITALFFSKYCIRRA